MKINKFIDNTPREDIFHSNDLAKVAIGGTLGSTSAETFGRREGIERNRRAVQRYGSSMIGQGHMKEVAREQLDAGNPLRQGGLGARGEIRSAIPPRGFTEPPTRRYNPYN
jgi:hypothetical protein